MRISDWSSDVCSSDLLDRTGRDRQPAAVQGLVVDPAGVPQLCGNQSALGVHGVGEPLPAGQLLGAGDTGGVCIDHALDRKRGVSGTAVAARVDLGGVGFIKTKKKSLVTRR